MGPLFSFLLFFDFYRAFSDLPVNNRNEGCLWCVLYKHSSRGICCWWCDLSINSLSTEYSGTPCLFLHLDHCIEIAILSACCIFCHLDAWPSLISHHFGLDPVRDKCSSLWFEIYLLLQCTVTRDEHGTDISRYPSVLKGLKPYLDNLFMNPYI